MEQNLALKNKIKQFDEMILETSKFTKLYKNYFDQKETVKKFEDKYGNFNNEFSLSLVRRLFLAKKGLGRFF